MSEHENSGAGYDQAADETMQVITEAINQAVSYPRVAVQDAVDCIAAWGAFNRYLIDKYKQSKDFLRAYLIPKEDIEAMAAMFKGDSALIGCRVYVGMEPPLSDIVSAEPGFMKLFMVPVRPLMGSIAGIDIVENPLTKESLVYDFSLPCPSTCDIKSVLYKAADTD